MEIKEIIKIINETFEHKLIETIETSTDIIPEIVADSVAREAMHYCECEEPLKFINPLVTKAEKLFDKNPDFRKKIMGKGNTGRDYLYMFMRHWLAAFLKEKNPELFRKLPTNFSNGIN